METEFPPGTCPPDGLVIFHSTDEDTTGLREAVSHSRGHTAQTWAQVSWNPPPPPLRTEVLIGKGWASEDSQPQAWGNRPGVSWAMQGMEMQ